MDMDQKEIISLFERYGALLKGHFKLSSGLHSDTYLQCALVLQYPDVAEKLAKAIAKNFDKEKIGLVIGPALGGVTIAYEVARALGVRALFTERQDGGMVLRRGFSIAKGENTLVVEDVVTTGGSTKEVIAVVEAAGGKISGVASIIDRSGGKAAFSARFESLAKVDAMTFEEKDCPLCKAGSQAVKPGSRK
jgi:orotate phosphoribosyltransferase